MPTLPKDALRVKGKIDTMNFMTKEIFVIFGRNTELAMAEWEAGMELLGFMWKTQEHGGQVLLGSISGANIDTKRLQHQFGGVIKMGEILETLRVAGSREETLQHFLHAEMFIKILPEKNIRANVGLSFYSLNKKSSPQRLSARVIRHALKLKNDLKNQGRNVRFVTSKQADLSSVILTQEKVLDRGVELDFILSDTEIFVGRTLTVQDFKSYSHRDYGRPARDAYSGMLPPKVAQMMVNLSHCPLNGTLMDPFCGSGTILQEAMLLGYKNLRGSDLSEDAVTDTNKNLTWFMQEYRVDADVDLFVSDVIDLEGQIPKGSMDAIVTEPYLGPADKGRVNAKTIEKNLLKLEHLYKDAFRILTQLLKRHGRLVVVIPSFHFQGQTFHLPIPSLFPPALTIQQQLSYSRPNQYVTRTIVVAQKQH